MLTRTLSRRQLLGQLGGGALLTSAGLLTHRCVHAGMLPVPTQRPVLPQPRLLGEHEPVIAQTVALAHGQTGLGYNGSSPGPTIRVIRGQWLRKTLMNRLDQATSMHWHGITVPSEMDGQPQEVFAPGETRQVAFPIVQRAGLHWYHPHPHGSTGWQVWHGLAGFFIVHDEEEAALGLPDGTRERLLVLRDTQVDADGRIVYAREANGTTGDTPLINGVPWPQTRLGNGINRLRILNGSNARIFQLTSKAPLILIGNDGGLLEAPQPVDSISIAPAERMDVLIDLRGIAPGSTVTLRDSSADWDLLDIQVVDAPRHPWEIPTRLSRIERLHHDGPPDREFVFQQDHGINGLSHAMERIDFIVPHGKVERWRLRQARGRFHPVHIHGAHFQIERTSLVDGQEQRVFRPWEQGWKDVVVVGRGGFVDVLVRFDHYEGRYMLHCHKLEHEDEGMMMNFVVAKDPEMAARRIELAQQFGSDGVLCVTR